MRSALVKRAGFLAPEGGRQHHVGQFGRLGQERVLHDHEELDLSRIGGRARSSGSDTAGLVPMIQSKRIEPRSRSGKSASRAWAAPHAGMSLRLDVPDARQVRSTCSGLSQLRKAGNSPFAPRLAGVLRRRLAVHLQHAAARLANHARGSGAGCSPGTAAAVAWFDWYTPCSTRGNKRRRGAEDLCGCAQTVRPGTPVICSTRSGVHFATVSSSWSKPTVCVSINCLVDTARLDDQVEQAVEQRRHWCRGAARGGCRPLSAVGVARGSTTMRRGRVRPGAPVEHARPQHRLRAAMLCPKWKMASVTSKSV